MRAPERGCKDLVNVGLTSIRTTIILTDVAPNLTSPRPGVYRVTRPCRTCGGAGENRRGDSCPACEGNGAADVEVADYELRESELEQAIAQGLLPCERCGVAYAGDDGLCGGCR